MLLLTMQSVIQAWLPGQLAPHSLKWTNYLLMVGGFWRLITEAQCWTAKNK